MPSKSKTLTQELVERGISESVAIDFAESFPEEYLREKIEMHDVKKATGELTTNAAGWLREAIARDYTLSEEQQRKLEVKARKKEVEEREEKLRAEAEKIQEQRLKEAIANFLEKHEWVEDRVQRAIEVRKMLAESSGLDLLTDEEIEERRRMFHEQYPMTKKEKRTWLAGEEASCRLEVIMDELKSGEKKREGYGGYQKSKFTLIGAMAELESSLISCYCKGDKFCARAILKEILEKIISKLKQKVEYQVQRESLEPPKQETVVEYQVGRGVP